jgi:hypothetical protein
MYFLWILQQTATFAIHCLNVLGFVTEVEGLFTAQLLEIMLHCDFCCMKFSSAKKLKTVFTVSLILDRLHCPCKLSGDSPHPENGGSTLL